MYAKQIPFSIQLVHYVILYVFEAKNPNFLVFLLKIVQK